MLKEMFKKTKYISLESYNETTNAKNSNILKQSSIKPKEDIEIDNEEVIPQVPDGLWKKCDSCGETIYTEDINNNYFCCPKCNKHFRVGANSRIHMIVDDGSFIEWDKNLTSKNILNFPNYDGKIKDLQLSTGLSEAVVTGEGSILGNRAMIAVMDNSFLMGSMGEAVGEKITRAIEKATSKGLPIIIFTTSGGARMQEGIVSLMQMAKTSAALKRHSDANLLCITVLCDPTTGGVTASFAMLGDIILAEPNALIGFAGPRVIEQTIGTKLPDGFQRAEFLLEKGFVDMIVNRSQMQKTLSKILFIHKN